MITPIQNTAELRSFNTKRIITYIRAQQSSTRRNIAAALDLSFATVSNICNQLITEGILRETRTKDFSGGRLPKLLLLNEASRVILCCYLLCQGVYEISIADLNGKELDTTILETKNTMSLRELTRALYQASETMLARMRKTLASVIGIAVAAPGIYSTNSGNIINSTDPLFENQPLAAMLTDIYKLPVFIENESNLLVTAAAIDNNATQRFRDVIYLYVGVGVGVGIISNGSLVMGHHGMGGEIEHMPLGLREYPCYCGHTSCIETELIEAGFLKKWIETAQRDAAHSSWQDFVAAAQKKEPAALRVVEENGRLIGTLLSVLANIFDPETIYAGGIIQDFFEQIRPFIEQELAKRLVAGALRHIPLVADTDYRSMIIRGCAARVFSQWRV